MACNPFSDPSNARSNGVHGPKAACSPPPFSELGGLENGAPGVAATSTQTEDAEFGLRSRVAMLRDKLLQKRQEHDNCSPGPAPGSEEAQKGAGSLVDSFLAEDSNRHALQTLAEDLARKRGEVGKGDKLGLPPAVDIPKAELGDELLQDFMSRSRMGLGSKDPARATTADECVTDTNGTDEQTASANVGREVPKEKKVKKKKKMEDKVVIPENTPENPKKAKKDKSRKSKAKCHMSEESNGAPQAVEKTKEALESKPPKQPKVSKKGHKRKKDVSSGKSSEAAQSIGKDKNRKNKEPKAEERSAKERHAGEIAKHKERKGDRAERARERRDRSPRCSKRQDRSRHHSHPRRQARSRSRRRGRSHNGRAKRSSASSSTCARSCSSRSGCGKDHSRAASPQEFKVYSRVTLHGLQVNTDLNGLCGVVAPPGLPRTGEMTGTYKVRLENAREVAVKPVNLQSARSELSPSRERRLRMVLDRMRTTS